MICLSCAEFRDVSGADPCPGCGKAMVAATREHHEELVARRVKKLVSEWSQAGIVDGKTASRIVMSMSKRGREAVTEPARESKSERRRRSRQAVENAARLQQEDAGAARKERERALEREREARRQEESTRTAAQRREEEAIRHLQPAPAPPKKIAPTAMDLLRPTPPPEPEPRAEPETEPMPPRDGHEHDAGHAASVGRALYRGAGAGGGALGGVDALVALDEAPPSAPSRLQEAWPFLREYVWWFIGTLLVVAGSIMGVREAWRTLAGASRQALVAGALFAYHGGFVGLAAVVGKRSATAGRVLGTIAIGLLPVVFVAVAALVDLSPVTGVALGALLASLSYLSLSSIARRFGDPARQLPMLLVPSLLAELPLAMLPGVSWLRLALPLVGVGTIAIACGKPGTEKSPPGTTLGATLYASLALIIFALVGAPDEGAVAAAPPLAGLALWCATLGGVLADLAGRPTLRARLKRGAPALDLIALALAACAALAAALGALFSDGPLPSTVAATAAAAVATATFYRAEARHPAATHVTLLGATLTATLLVRLVAPTQPAWWPLGATLVAAAALLQARRGPAPAAGKLVGWAVALGVLAPLTALNVEGPARVVGTLWASIVTSFLVAAVAHALAGPRRAIHYLGGFAATVGAGAWLLPLPGSLPLPWPSTSDVTVRLVLLALGAAVAYGAIGLLEERLGPGDAEGKARRLQPFDDLSLTAVLFAFVVAAPNLPPLRAFLLLPGGGVLGDAAPAHELVLVIGLVLLARALRDGSRAVSALAWLALGVVAVSASGARSAAQVALTVAALAFVAALTAALRGTAAVAKVEARSLFGRLPLPSAARGRILVTDGLAVASWIGMVVACCALISFLSDIVEPERGWAILGGALLVATSLAGFLTPAWHSVGMRGALVTLFLGGAMVTFTALVNRVGRPLAPQVIGRNLSGVIVAVWLAAQGLRRVGPGLGRWLGREKEGDTYHIVPHVGVGALGLLLAVDAYLVARYDASRSLVVTPPMLLVGAALATALLARQGKWAALWHGVLAMLLPAAALVAVQRHLLGPTLVPLDLPGSRWVVLGTEALARRPSGWLDPTAWIPAGERLGTLWERAFLGVAATGAVLAVVAVLLGRPRLGRGLARVLLDDASAGESLEKVVRSWVVGTAAVTLMAAAFQPRVPAALLFLVAGGLLFLGRSRWVGELVLTSGVVLLIHAAAHLTARFPWWPGPTLAAVGLAAVVAAPLLAPRLGKGEASLRVQSQWLAAAVGLLGVSYAFVSGGVNDRDNALAALLQALGSGLGADPSRAPALALTLALGAVTFGLVARQHVDLLARFSSAATVLLVGVAAWVALIPAAGTRLVGDTSLLEMALAQSCLAAAAHVANRRLAARVDHAWGARLGRDALLVFAGLLASIFAFGVDPATLDPARALFLGVTALVVAAGVCVHAAWRERSARHVYFIHLCVVGTYGLTRTLLAARLPPEVDALFALILAFILVGVAVQARRAGIPPVAAATRRFAALLPLALGLALQRGPTTTAALLAAGSSLLYGTLAAVERSRLFGSLGALAANVALLIAALAFDVDGVEIYLAPFGLLVLMLGRIFTKSLTPETRRLTQVIGGLFIYLPAALKMSMQLGQRASGTYAVLFGAVCLFGVAAGVVLQIRAYLALGTIFLVLDVAANLVYAGLRDHRIGFWVLSLSGLAILGGMVLTTLRREQFRAFLTRARARLKRWD